MGGIVRFQILITVALMAQGAAATGLMQQQGSTQPLVPADAIAGVTDAFQSHDVVALPDAHGNAESHAFRLALIRDPRLSANVDDIVIRLGNARYQDLVDRYVRGEDVPVVDLHKAWQDTTVSTAGNNYPMAEELLGTVRAVNASRRGSRQLRILLGDPPIDWGRVQSRADHHKYLALRDSHPAALIISEVLAKNRKALLMYGELHFQRRNIMTNYDMQAWQAQTIISLIEAATPARVFTIWESDVETLGADARSWAWPRLATVRGTSVGAADFATFVGSPLAAQRSSIADGRFTPIPASEFRRLTVEEQLDAILFLGPRTPGRPSHEVPIALCKQPGFVDEQARRISLSAPRFEADRLREYCAKVVQ